MFAGFYVCRLAGKSAFSIKTREPLFRKPVVDGFDQNVLYVPVVLNGMKIQFRGMDGRTHWTDWVGRPLRPGDECVTTGGDGLVISGIYGRAGTSLESLGAYTTQSAK